MYCDHSIGFDRITIYFGLHKGTVVVRLTPVAY